MAGTRPKAAARARVGPRGPAPSRAALPLNEACVQVAQALIAENGVEHLSLRDVARRLGVSHQAPYRHYPSRDHLLAEVIRRCFERFASALRGRDRDADPILDMRSLGRTYLEYALKNPLEYKLMFGTPWPDTATHPDLLRDARAAFEVLRETLASLYRDALGRDDVDLNAMFVWSAMHGLATILQGQVMQHLDVSARVVATAVDHVMGMIDAALLTAAPQSP